MNITPYLDLMVKNDRIFEALKHKYPDLLADLTSSKYNPTCSCRGRVANHLNKKYEEGDKDFIDFILSLEEIRKEKEEIDQVIKEKENQPKKELEALRENSTSHIYQVPKGPKGWEDFNQFVMEKRIVFRSFSVLDKGDHLEVYFL